jgi:hypothetical protein
MSAHKPNPLLTIGFTPDALNDGALQTVMIALIGHTFRVEFTVDDPDSDEVHLKGVVGHIMSASNTELTIAHSAMRYHPGTQGLSRSGSAPVAIPWEDIKVLEFQ